MSLAWVCPKCGASLGPLMTWCPCSPPAKPGVTTSSGPGVKVTVMDCGCPVPGHCVRSYCPRRTHA